MQQYQVPVIRKGAIILSNNNGHLGYRYHDTSGYGYGEAEGVADRLRTIAGMKRELANRKDAIKTFEDQLKDAKGQERQRIKDLIQKYKKDIRELEKGIEAKEGRKAKRGRFWERAKARFGVYSGADLGDMAEDAFDDMSGVVEDYANWYRSQNTLVQIGIVAAIGFAGYKAYGHFKKGK